MTQRLAPSDPAPAFTLLDDTGQEVSLSDFAGNRVVVYFYPAALTPGCTTQAIDFTAASDAFHDARVVVLGISPDEPEKLARFRSKESISIPLLSDPDHGVLEAYGAWGEKVLYGKKITGVIRSTFVIDVDEAGNGTVAVAQYNVKATGHVQRLRAQLSL